MATPPNNVEGSASSAVVNIAVEDPLTHRERIFECTAELILKYMHYFEPHIHRRLSEAQQSKPRSSVASLNVTLRARCEHATFQWLMDWMVGKASALTNGNVVSICLAASFLQMHKLSDDTLLYLSTHLPEVVLSPFDLTSLPMHLILRLGNIIRDTDIAAVLLQLYEQRHADHPNRAFVASLLQHYVFHQIRVAEESSAPFTTTTAPSAAEMTADAHDELVLSSSGGLKWCRMCKSLFDEAELQRLTDKAQFHPPVCPMQLTPVACTSNLPNVSEPLSNFTKSVGPRGELIATHTAARHAGPVVLEAPPPLKLWQPSADSTVSPSSPAVLERWAWRIIGASRYVNCCTCLHLVSLIDAPYHRCSELAVTYTSPNNAVDEIHYLLRWFDYCAEHGVYEREGGLTPIKCGAARAKKAAGARCFASEGGAPCGARNESSASAVVNPYPHLSGRLTLPAEEGTTPGGAAAAASGRGSNGHSAFTRAPGIDLSLWVTNPFYVDEVTSEGVIDLDILNYIERQHRLDAEAQQRSSVYPRNIFPMRLAPAAVFGGAGGTGPPNTSSLPLRNVFALGGGCSSAGGSRSQQGLRGGKPQTAPSNSPYGLLTALRR